MSVGRFVSAVARRLAVLPLQMLDRDTHAEALQMLIDRAIATGNGGSVPLKFFAPTPLLRRRAAAMLDKEPDTIAWIDTFDRCAVFWDVGANVGVFALYAAAVRGCRVLAFEPSAANYFVISRNVELNALADRMTAYCLAVAPATELGVINLDSADLGAAMSQFGRPGDASRYGSRHAPIVQGVAGVTLEDLVARFNAPPPTYLKIDVDGLELPILQGGRTLLRHPALREIMVELSLIDHAERARAVELLHDSGFALRSHGAAQGGGAEQAANHLFVRR